MEFRHLHTYRLPRGRRFEIPWFQATPPPPPAYPPQSVRARAKAYRPRRGERFEPLLVQAVAPTSVVGGGRRKLALPVRRGHRFEVPQAGAVAPPVPPDWVAAPLHSQRRGVRTRRGDILAIPPVQGVPAPRGAARGNRSRPPLIARGQRFESFGQVTCPARPSRSRRAVPIVRRGRVLSFVPAQVAPAPPPAWAPPITAARRRIGVRIRRGWRSFVIALGFTAPVPVPDIPTELALDARTTSLTLGRVTELTLGTRSTTFTPDGRTTGAALDTRTTLLTEGARSTDLPLDQRKTEVITDG